MVNIREFLESDFSSVKFIYQQGIETGNALFQQEAKEWEEWNASLLPVCRLVAELKGTVVGWAALSPVSSRRVYSGVAEVSVYIALEVRGRRIGCSLLRELVSASEQEGFWTLQAGIFPENQPSIIIHSKNDFKRLGVREKLGKMDGKWRDVLLMERRSKVVGVCR